MPPGERQRRLLEALERWRSGEHPHAAFRDIAELLYGPLHGYLKRQVGAEDALDLTQESLVGIYKGLPGFRDEARFTTWAFAIAKNTVLKRRRSHEAQKRGPEPLSLEDQLGEKESDTPDPFEQALGRERRALLRRATSKLPPRMRAVLTLHLYQERSRSEIAEALGVSQETVKAQLAQAKRRLAEELEDAK